MQASLQEYPSLARGDKSSMSDSGMPGTRCRHFRRNVASASTNVYTGKTTNNLKNAGEPTEQRLNAVSCLASMLPIETRPPQAVFMLSWPCLSIGSGVVDWNLCGSEQYIQQDGV